MPQPHGFCSCGPIGGPTEEDYHCIDDSASMSQQVAAIFHPSPTAPSALRMLSVGLIQDNTTALTSAWSTTMDIVQQVLRLPRLLLFAYSIAILVYMTQVVIGAGAWAWQYFVTFSTPPQSQCASVLRSVCAQGVEWGNYSAGVQYGACTLPIVGPHCRAVQFRYDGRRMDDHEWDVAPAAAGPGHCDVSAPAGAALVDRVWMVWLRPQV